MDALAYMLACIFGGFLGLFAGAILGCLFFAMILEALSALDATRRG